MNPHEFKKLRKRVGTQDEVADALGVSKSLIGHMEAGRRDVRPAYALALCWLESQQQDVSASRPTDASTRED